MSKTVGIVGAGAAGLVTARTLLQDGFDVTVITRDPSPGGTWCKERLYPGILINNVHGEYRFSSLPMPERPDFSATGGRLSGEDMRGYMEVYADHALKDSLIRYNLEVNRVQRVRNELGAPKWALTCTDKLTGVPQIVQFDKLILCTGGCSEPLIPECFSPIEKAFDGIVVHSSEYRRRLDEIMASTTTTCGANSARIVVIGGGKSAMDIAAYLTNEGRQVSIVFETADSFLASPIPLPPFIRKSRLLGILSPHIDLRTMLERFLHTTWLGSKIVHGFWNLLAWASLRTFSIPQGSPLRNNHSMFWSIRINDEGVGRENGFYDLVNKGMIELIAPARASSYGPDKKSVVLNNGRIVKADVIILATGYKSSWERIFDDATKEELGLGNHDPILTPTSKTYQWNYSTLKNPPRPKHGKTSGLASSLYRGMIPAKNILRRDFAVNGAIFSINNGLVFEVASNWISSYFLGDPFLKVPSSVEEAFESTEREAAFLRKRHPDALLWVNESYSGLVKLFTWPQFIDELLEDMRLPIYRSGGNWLTWPFKVMDLREIERLGEERRAKRVIA